MRIIFPAQKRVLSEGPDLWAREAQKAEPKSAESKNAEQKAAEWKNAEPKNVVEPELIRAQRKVIRRSPRSGNRI